MNIKTFDIEGPKLITLDTFGDSRGFFVERFNLNRFKQHELPTDFVQDNYSRSTPGVVRGLHYQINPAQGKLVTCTDGEIFDVAVDIRKDSPTFGKSVSVTLRGDKPEWFWIPEGFAHGFAVTGDGKADLMYKVTSFYSKEGDKGLMWNDPELKVDWPFASPELSEKDTTLQSFGDYKQNPDF